MRPLRPTSFYVALFIFFIVSAWMAWFFMNFPQKPIPPQDTNIHYSSWVIDTSDKTWQTLPDCEMLTDDDVRKYGKDGWCNMFTESDQDKIFVEKISAYINSD